ncbi:hypothetical protein [Deinococcus sp.]|uniref:hypothetical protein n=1 Tax=Deinococcus sp. TaxID=47478 RepID=UPI003CC5E1CD
MSELALRVVFALTAALFVFAGLLIYFLPPAALPVSPLWLARVTGAVLVAWGASLLAGARRPTLAGVVGLAAGNLLIVATLVPAALRSGLSAALQLGFYLLSGLLLGLALLALLLPRDRRGQR